jgi:hypothetical protein
VITDCASAVAAAALPPGGGYLLFSVEGILGLLLAPQALFAAFHFLLFGYLAGVARERRKSRTVLSLATTTATSVPSALVA